MARTIGIIGCGWLGAALGAALVARGERVLGTTTSPARGDELRRLGIAPLVARFGAGGAVFEPGSARPPDAFAAADVCVVAVPPLPGDEAISQARAIAGVIGVARAAHVVQISTTSVYPNANVRVDEADAINHHRLTLVEQEFRGLDRVVTVLRCAGLFGPGRLILPSILRASVDVDPEAPVNLVARSDVVRAILRVMEEPVADVFNVCADEHPSKEAFYREIARRTGLSVPPFRPSGEAWKIVGNDAFKRRFGFEYSWPDPLAFPVE